jgi:dolichol-phosphate mannosyltransferase
MLSLVLPTYNEAENLPELLPKIHDALSGIPHEIIVVDDDSHDHTWEVALRLSQEMADTHVIRRIGRRGLSSAVIEGFLSAKGDVLAVMDADGQHDIALLPALSRAAGDGSDLVIGSRYIKGGNIGTWDERRYWLSRVATRLAKKLCRVQVEDPMSGFFAIRRETFQAALPTLNPKGFKILLDILVHAPHNVVVREIPLKFGVRIHGESKLSRQVQIEFLEYLYDVTIGRYIPLMFVKYCIVGSLGVFVHTGTYYAASTILRGGSDLTIGNFSLSVMIAVETAILFNFLLNNLWTFAHNRLRGAAAVFGFFKFNIACIFGALANLAVSTFLFSRGSHELLSVIIGACTGVVWNYTMSRLLTWRTTQGA